MISKVMIIGSGQMGSGIAQVFAQAGFAVYLNDIKEEFVQRGLNKDVYKRQRPHYLHRHGSNRQHLV